MITLKLSIIVLSEVNMSIYSQLHTLNNGLIVHWHVVLSLPSIEPFLGQANLFVGQA